MSVHSCTTASSVLCDMYIYCHGSEALLCNHRTHILFNPTAAAGSQAAAAAAEGKELHLCHSAQRFWQGPRRSAEQEKCHLNRHTVQACPQMPRPQTPLCLSHLTPVPPRHGGGVSCFKESQPGLGGRSTCLWTPSRARCGQGSSGQRLHCCRECKIREYRHGTDEPQ